jgi:hypothetical protein
MKYRYSHQLILQLPGSSIRDYDAMIKLENCIIDGLENLGEVDGHDMGSGEMNIFVHTDNPKLAFEKIKSLIGIKDFMPELKAAFRNVSEDNYTILYPAWFTHFKIA